MEQSGRQPLHVGRLKLLRRKAEGIGDRPFRPLIDIKAEYDPTAPGFPEEIPCSGPDPDKFQEKTCKIHLWPFATGWLHVLYVLHSFHVLHEIHYSVCKNNLKPMNSSFYEFIKEPRQ